MNLDSGHKVEPIVGEEDELLKKDFSCHKVGTFRLLPQGWIVTQTFLDFANKIYNFQFRPSDILIMTFPKSGTSWTQELVWTMVNNPKLDNPASKIPVNFRSPFIEYDCILENPCAKALYSSQEEDPRYRRFKEICPEGKVEDGMFLQMADAVADPRIIKTHLGLSFFKKDLLDTCKVIYVSRNPKDVCISFCHHARILKSMDFHGSFDDFVQHFVNDRLLYGPYWKHMQEVYEQRSHPNLHSTSYEKLKANTDKEISKLSQFLGLQLSEQERKNVIDHSDFSTMKKREGTSTGTAKGLNLDVIKKDGGFFRKGVSGDWKSGLTLDQAKLIDDWTEVNIKRMNIDPEWLST